MLQIILIAFPVLAILIVLSLAFASILICPEFAPRCPRCGSRYLTSAGDCRECVPQDHASAMQEDPRSGRIAVEVLAALTLLLTAVAVLLLPPDIAQPLAALALTITAISVITARGHWRKNDEDAGDGRNAFTLIELLLVMGLMAILAALTIPAIAPLLRGRALDSATGSVTMALYEARSAASARGRPLALLLDGPGGTFTVADADGIRNADDPALSDPSRRLDAPAFLPAGVQFKLTDGAAVTDPGGNPKGQAIIFRPSGGLDPRMNGGPGPRVITIVTVKPGGGERRIEVNFASGLPQK